MDTDPFARLSVAPIGIPSFVRSTVSYGEIREVMVRGIPRN